MTNKGSFRSECPRGANIRGGKDGGANIRTRRSDDASVEDRSDSEWRLCPRSLVAFEAFASSIIEIHSSILRIRDIVPLLCSDHRPLSTSLLLPSGLP